MLDFILKMRRDVLEGREVSYENALRFTTIGRLEIPYLAAAANEIRTKFM